jgi:hypothetical protein
VNSGAANDMDTFGKRISPQVIQEIELSAYRGGLSAGEVQHIWSTLGHAIRCNG